MTIRQLRRKRDRARRRHRVELSLDEVDVVVALAGRRPVRRARGRAGQGREERLGGAAPRSSPRIRRSRRPAAASSRRRWRRSSGGRRVAHAPSDRRRRRDAPSGRRTATGWASSADERADRAQRPTTPRPSVREAAGQPAAGIGRGCDAGTAAEPASDAVPSRRLVGRHQRGRRGRRRRPTTALVVGKTPGRDGRRPRRRGRSQGHALPPRPDARPRGRHPRRAATPRSSTRCASRPAASGPPGASSVRRSGPAGRSAIGRGLREIAARLGAVRDLDVLLEAADAYRADLPVAEQRALEPLLADWREHRDDARVLLIRELDSDGYRRWVDDYRDFVRTEGVGGHAGRARPSRIASATPPPSRIWAAYEQVRGYEPVLRWADVETLHELRIAGEVAALHARVRARGARRRRRAADRPGHRAPGPPRADERRRRRRRRWPGRSSSSTPASCRRSRAPRSGATWSVASARSRACGGRSGRPWRGVAGRHVPAHARAGRRRAVGRGRRVRA